MTTTTDLIQAMIVGLASGTDEGRTAAEEAGKQAILQKTAEVLSNMQDTEPTMTRSTETI